MEEIDKLYYAVLGSATNNKYKSNNVAHDTEHIRRVYYNAQRIARKEKKKINHKVLFSAVLLHDIVSYKKSGYDPKKSSAEDSAKEAAKILRKLGGYTNKEIASICKVIKEHSFSEGKKPSSTESAILQDADRLDAIGAVGVARVFAVGGFEKRKMYNPDDPVCIRRKPDDKKWTLDHFFTKLNLLEEKMNTKSARSEAKKRTRLMTRFLNVLYGEIKPEDNKYS